MPPAVTIQFSWTASGNYPAGGNPWNGQPLAVAPAGSYYSPNQKPPAEEINFIFGNWIEGDLGNLAAAVNPLAFPARNWHAVAPAYSASAGPYAFAWNDAAVGNSSQNWMAIGFNPSGSSTWSLYYETGTGDLPVTVGPVSETASDSPPSGLCANPTNGDVWVTQWYAGAIYAWVALGGNLSSWTVGANGNGFAGISDTKCIVQSGNPVVAIGSTTAGNAGIYKLIASAGLGTTYLSGLTVSAWILKSNGTICLAIPRQASATPVMYSSVTGTSWPATSLAGKLSSTETPFDVAWNAGAGLWLMTVSVTSNQTRFMTSPDGLTWTNVGTTLTTGNVWSLAASGNFWVAVFQETLASTFRVIFSMDGVRWYRTNTFLSQTSGSTYLGRLAQSPTAVCAYFDMGALITDPPPYRFSAEGGLPDVLVT